MDETQSPINDVTVEITPQPSQEAQEVQDI